MSIEVSISLIRDSDNSHPSQITIGESEDRVYIELSNPTRYLAISKEDWSKLCLVISPIK